MNSTSDEIRLREIAERCESTANTCFDLTTAERLRELAADVRAVADNLSLALGLRRTSKPPPE